MRIPPVGRLSGVSPFMSERNIRQETFVNITSVKYTFDQQLFGKNSPGALDFIANLLRRRPRYVIEWS